MGAGASAQASLEKYKTDAKKMAVDNFLHDKAKIKALWKRIDSNGDGYTSLAEIDRMCGDVDEFKAMFRNKEAMIRAYKATCYGTGGDGDAWVERKEFVMMLRNLYYFNSLWNVFDNVDTGNDKRIDLNEFELGMQSIGIELTHDEAVKVFEEMDGNSGGQVLFNEFCKYCANVLSPAEKAATLEDDAEFKANPGRKPPRKMRQKRRRNPTGVPARDVPVPVDRTGDFDALEQKMRTDMQDASKLKAMWKVLDIYGNGKVTLNEIDKMVVQNYPLLNNKPAITRAYQKTICQDGEGDDWVEYPHEFKALLLNLFYFNKLWDVFDDIDTAVDRTIDLGEFCTGLARVGGKLARMTVDEAEDAFDEIDSSNSGSILFDDFCKWVAKKGIGGTLSVS